MLLAETRRQARGQVAVGQQGIEVEGLLGYSHSLAVDRYRAMQVSQRLAVIEPGELRHHPVQQVEETIRLGDKGSQPFAPVDAALSAVLVEQAGGARARLLGRQVE